MEYPNVSDKKRSGSEMLNNEWDNKLSFFPPTKRVIPKHPTVHFSNQNCFRDDFTGKSWTGLIYAVERLANQKHQISNGACVLMCAVGEKDFGFWQAMSTAMFTNKRTILEEIEAVIIDDIIYEMPEILMSELWNHGGSHWHRPSRTRSYKNLSKSSIWWQWCWTREVKKR